MMDARRGRVAGATFFALCSLTVTASADKSKRHSTWQSDWATGVAGPKASCVAHEEIRGENCGYDDSLAVKLKNTCKEPVRVHYCLERNNGKLSCGLVRERGANKRTNGAWTCHASGRWRVLACETDAGCRVDREILWARKDGTVRLGACVTKKLDEVAERYHRETGKPIIVTDGNRTPNEQAKQLHDKLLKGEDLTKLYAAKALAAEVTNAWKALPEDERKAKGAATIGKVVEKQVKEKKYISKHLRKSAADVRTRDLNDGELKKLKQMLEDAGIQVVDETKKAKPHYHLSIAGCD